MSTSYSPKIVTDGLVLALDAANTKSYPGSGTVWSNLTLDTTVNASLVNGAIYNSANNGTISFDGTNDYATIPDTLNKTEFTRTDNYTLVCWANVSSTQNYGVYSFKPIIDKNGREGGVRQHPYGMVHISASNVIRSSVGNGTLSNDVEVPFELDTWKMITSVYSWSTSLLTVYVNEIQNSGSLDITGTITNTSNLSLCRTDGITNYTDANIAFVSIYNRALSANEVLQNFNATRGRFGV